MEPRLGLTNNGQNVAVTATDSLWRAHWDFTDQIPERAVEQGLISEFGCIPLHRRRQHLALQPLRSPGSRIGHTQTAAAYAIRHHRSLHSDFTYYLNDPNAIPRGWYPYMAIDKK